MITVKEAQNAVEASLPDLVPEAVAIDSALTRTLAETIRAPFALPRFTNSAMDGFAVRAVDVTTASKETPVVLKLTGMIRAGQKAEASVFEGECIQVMTGASLPPGADTVVPVEYTNGFEAREVEIYQPFEARRNIRFEGEEIEVSRPILHPGTRLGPAELGVLVSFGYSEVRVYQKPRVALFGTGDELREPGQPLEGCQVYDSNLHVLSDLARRVGAEVVYSALLRDDRETLKSFLAKALKDCDVVVSSGGVSMGRFDFVRSILLDLGVQDRFWRVAQKPGKPLFFGTTAGDTLVFGLPGNPVSSFVGFMEYVWPTLEKFQGLRPVSKVKGILSAPFPRDEERHRFLFGRAALENGVLQVAPTTRLGSHMLTSALGACCILEAPPGEGALGVGEEVTVRLLPWAEVGPMERD